MAMSEPLSSLSLTSPPPPPQLATPPSSSTDDGVDMSAGDEEDIIKNFGATSRYAGKLSSCVPKVDKSSSFLMENSVSSETPLNPSHRNLTQLE